MGYNKECTALKSITCYAEQEQRVNNADASGIPPRRSNPNLSASPSTMAQAVTHQDSTLKLTMTATFHILPSSPFTNHTTIQSCRV
jgi:hypothetical protein